MYQSAGNKAEGHLSSDTQGDCHQHQFPAPEEEYNSSKSLLLSFHVSVEMSPT